MTDPSDCSSTTKSLGVPSVDTGVGVAGDYIDRATGKPYYKLTPPAAAGASGTVAALMSNYHVLCQYLPAGTNQRVLYRTVALPRGELNMALRAVRGATWTPEEPGAALAAGQQGTTQLASTGPSSSQPAAGDALAAALKPPTLLDRVKQKEWVVTVVVVRAADVATLDQQIRAEQAKLPDIENRFNRARVYADQLEGEKVRQLDRFGRYVQVNSRTPKEIGDARVIADRINEERRQAKQRVARLERERKDAATSRTVIVKLDDSTTAQVDCEGPALVTVADSLLPDTRWKVSGAARIVEDTLHIKPRAFVPAE
ncbi:MAG: hypothetical protein QOI61_1606 [Actinomycetota bacterium]